jgi:SAM-dependent methyltransferase
MQQTRSGAGKGGPMTAHTDLDAREALAERLVDATTHALETLSVHLGLELGLYQALADLGAATETEVAAHAGVAPRYAREWLEQQTVAGYLACDDPKRPAKERRYRLPAGHTEVLLDADSPYHAGPLAGMLASVARVLPQLLAVYRSGGGVPYAAYGPEMRRGIAAVNRPMFLHELASSWLPAVPGLDRRLRSAPPARVLDLGCGLGASSIALARTYPRAQVLGVDLDQASVTDARAAAATAGVADRVTFVVGDAAQLASEARFDLVTVFEALHDMGDPVGMLRAVRARLAAGGSVLVADERVADAFTTRGDPTERFMYGWSTLHCLPATLAEHPVEATGTVLRAPTLARWAATAGFGGFEVLPIDNPFWRFYRLRG